MEPSPHLGGVDQGPKRAWAESGWTLDESKLSLEPPSPHVSDATRIVGGRDLVVLETSAAHQCTSARDQVRSEVIP